MINEILLGDCLELMKDIPDGSIDMVLCDLPYGTTQCKWDTIIPLDKLWKEYNRVCKKNAAIILTAAQPFTSNLVMSNPKYFKYNWIWEKSKATGYLNAKKMPMRAHEDVCVFYIKPPTYNPQMVQGKPYNKGTAHRPTDVYGSQGLKAKTKRKKQLQKMIREKDGTIKDNALELLILEVEKSELVCKESQISVNSNLDCDGIHDDDALALETVIITQLDCNDIDEALGDINNNSDCDAIATAAVCTDTDESFGVESIIEELVKLVKPLKTTVKNDTGLRYPRTVQYFKTAESEGKKSIIHPTQKPLALFEYLVKTYSNEGDLVLDNCIGGGTTAVACINTNRNYIGMELDEEYHKKCLERIKKVQEKLDK